MKNIKAGNIKIAGKVIGENQPCFIIAEAGVNHNGDLRLAKKLVDAAKKAGANVVKFQTFKSENLVTLKARQARYQSKNIGRTKSQYNMLKKLELSYADFEKLKTYCAKKGIIFASTPHSSKEDIDLIAKLCPFIKIGSGDLANMPMLRYAATKNLPIILSTGMANMQEVRRAVRVILPVNKKLILLHCTTNYPCPLNEVNLRAMLSLKKELGLPVGYSDHTEGILVSAMAVAMGACVIEKHFTLDKNLPGPDHKASLNPEELQELVKAVRNVEKAMGGGVKKPAKSEEGSKKVIRKSIVANKDISQGAVITKEMLVIKRPGTGIEPKYLEKIIGRKAKKNIKRDSLLRWNHLIG